MTDRDTFELRFQAAMRGYLRHLSSDLDPVAFAHRIVATEPRRAGIAATLLGRGIVNPSYVWILVLMAALLAATIAVMAVGDFPPAPRPSVLHDVGLTPTAVDVLTAEPSAYWRMVADGTGVLWASDYGGRLVRFDPATGSGRDWTIGDDAAFTSSEIASAHAGGVWLVTGRTLRLFDGTAFRQVIEAPVEITVLTDAPDATLWAGTSAGTVLHWDGSSWATLDPGRPSATAEITAIHVDTADRTWIGWRDPEMFPAPGSVSRYDGSRWMRFDGSDAAPVGGAITSIGEAPDGTVWVASERGLARLRGTSWVDETPEAPGLVLSMSADRDGAMWVAGFLVDGPTTVGRMDGDSWAWYGPSDGLPAVGGYVGGIEATEHGVFVATNDGIIGRRNGRWESVWPPAPTGPTELAILLAVSHDELWAVGDKGLWHFLDGSWTYEEITADPSDAPTVLERAPNGTLWAGGSDGVAYRRDGRWTVADIGPASALAVDAGGTVWVAGTDTWRTTRLGTGPELWTLRFDGSAWVKRTVDGCPLQSLGSPVRSLVFDATGALWVGIPQAMEQGGLARYDGRRWETITTIARSDFGGATVLGTDPGGGVWVEVQYPYLTTDGIFHAQPVRAARFDGASWTLVDVPDGDGVHALLGSDGTLWASTRRGPARYDGTAWTFPYAGIALTNWTGGALGWHASADGTVFGHAGSSILRFSPVARSGPGDLSMDRASEPPAR